MISRLPRDLCLVPYATPCSYRPRELGHGPSAEVELLPATLSPWRRPSHDSWSRRGGRYLCQSQTATHCSLCCRASDPLPLRAPTTTERHASSPKLRTT